MPILVAVMRVYTLWQILAYASCALDITEVYGGNLRKYTGSTWRERNARWNDNELASLLACEDIESCRLEQGQSKLISEESKGCSYTLSKVFYECENIPNKRTDALFYSVICADSHDIVVIRFVRFRWCRDTFLCLLLCYFSNGAYNKTSGIHTTSYKI